MNLKTIAVDDASGPALDYMVGVVRGYSPDTALYVVQTGRFKPSSRWADGGPLIESVCIVTGRTDVCWRSETWCEAMRGLVEAYGSRYLVAAMRAYVKSHGINDADVPGVLL